MTHAIIHLNAVALATTDLAPVPDWVQLTPPGPRLQGRDGRAWDLLDPAFVVAAFNRGGVDLPVDMEHATELKAPKGEPAPAVGWINAMDVREGAVWARVAWTEAGREAVANRAYRYMSPVLMALKSNNQVVAIASAALTNRPNLALAALNSQTPETPMDPRLTAALNLADDAEPDAVVAAVNSLVAQVASPDITRWVPASEYNAALNRAAAAETALGAQAKAQREADITAAVDAAVVAGKITPAVREYYLDACRAEGGLEKFRTFVAAAPTIAPASGLGAADPAKADTALTADEAKIAAACGVSAEAFVATRRHLAVQQKGA